MDYKYIVSFTRDEARVWFVENEPSQIKRTDDKQSRWIVADDLTPLMLDMSIKCEWCFIDTYGLNREEAEDRISRFREKYPDINVSLDVIEWNETIPCEKHKETREWVIEWECINRDELGCEAGGLLVRGSKISDDLYPYSHEQIDSKYNDCDVAVFDTEEEAEEASETERERIEVNSNVFIGTFVREKD